MIDPWTAAAMHAEVQRRPSQFLSEFRSVLD
jgi:hypothetical protein